MVDLSVFMIGFSSHSIIYLACGDDKESIRCFMDQIDDNPQKLVRCYYICIRFNHSFKCITINIMEGEHLIKKNRGILFSCMLHWQEISQPDCYHIAH